MTTIKDIAELAGVSRTTVSRVLNRSGYVSETAEARVMEVIEETGYIPSEQAKAMRTKQTKVIGVVLPKISTETVSRTVDGIDTKLSEHGYHLLLANTNLDPAKEIEHLKLLQSRRVDGIIIVATNINDQLLKMIERIKEPVVAVGQDIPGIPCVLYNDYEASRDVTDHLLQKGHRHIGFIGVSEQDRAVGHERLRAFRDTMASWGCPVEENWVQQGVFDIESGYEAMKQIIETSKVRPTAVFAVTDRLAIGAMEYVRSLGWKIPEDISFIGIGSSDLSRYSSPKLSTVDYYNEQAGMKTAELLLDYLRGDKKTPEKFIMNYGLIERNSL
ncbi:LacI family DNA-binding transcriptional regulator [Salisediminibacterium halotolerans]|uniref:LacI family DNA-binding transcriptional regulator n=1 Tax=Salisediminibacterium halotolerans TaxID=517425 RepID=UPI000EB275E2|nr:LacI family DNA-binding transcriptional regulator [Salisediminibacterium halotolerans]RLJ73263.1 LacI family transcriptional regulator [Actinophytocola xinjiangensis]RPE86685.1 LacI family transcriptional regulator [Salisediminibacterium halotolerans]TWG34060.1 LacI family transcriptional regulator [Salisediminibacterium halotolerans]GEL08907.1 LacI family transcriptional regulator [Salisediminibacterium halotolerans]